MPNDPLLIYALFSAPYPVQVAKPARLTLLASLPPPPKVRGAILVSEISVLMPGGSQADALIQAPDTAGITVSLTPNDVWTAAWVVVPNHGLNLVVKPAGGGEAVMDRTHPLLIQIAGLPINGIDGTAELGIVETSRPDGGTSTRHDPLRLPVSKWPQSFAFGDFQAVDAVVGWHGGTRLTWTGDPGYQYSLAVDDGPPIPLTGQQKLNREVVVGPLTRSTLYTLRVEAGSGAQHKTAMARASVTVRGGEESFIGVETGVLRAAAAAFGGAVEVELGQPLGFGPWQDSFTYDPADGSADGDGVATVGRNSLGWYAEPAGLHGPYGYLAGAGGLRFFVDGRPVLSLDAQAGVTLAPLQGMPTGPYAPLTQDLATGRLIPGPAQGSSERFKEGIEPLRDDFAALLHARPVSFRYRADGQPGFGYLAEDLAALGLDRLVRRDGDGRACDVDYAKTGIYLLELVKDLYAEIARLRRDLATLRRDAR